MSQAQHILACTLVLTALPEALITKPARGCAMAIAGTVTLAAVMASVRNSKAHESLWQLPARNRAHEPDVTQHTLARVCGAGGSLPRESKWVGSEATRKRINPIKKYQPTLPVMGSILVPRW